MDDVLLPSDWACLIKMISLGFPMVVKEEERAECDVNNKSALCALCVIAAVVKVSLL